jgi:hypothetical protein
MLPETMRPGVFYERKDFYRKSLMLLICTNCFCSTKTTRSQEITGRIETFLVKGNQDGESNKSPNMRFAIGGAI